MLKYLAPKQTWFIPGMSTSSKLCGFSSLQKRTFRSVFSSFHTGHTFVIKKAVQCKDCYSALTVHVQGAVLWFREANPNDTQCTKCACVFHQLLLLLLNHTLTQLLYKGKKHNEEWHQTHIFLSFSLLVTPLKCQHEHWTRWTVIIRCTQKPKGLPSLKLGLKFKPLARISTHHFLH